MQDATGGVEVSPGQLPTEGLILFAKIGKQRAGVNRAIQVHRHARGVVEIGPVAIVGVVAKPAWRKRRQAAYAACSPASGRTRRAGSLGSWGTPAPLMPRLQLIRAGV